MTIRFLCPSGHSLSVPDDWAGRKVRCAGCKRIVDVPESLEGEPPKKLALAGQPERSPGMAASELGLAEWGETTKKQSVPPPLPSKPKAVESVRPGSTPPRTSGGTMRRQSPPERPRRMPPDVYRPDRGNLATVKWLALILGLVVVFSVSPVCYLRHFNLATAPGWARAVLMVAAVQAAYIAWMLIVPDWASVWVVMLVFAMASAVYAVATAVAVATPLEQPIWLDMGEVRNSAGAWSAAVLLAMSLATYLCGRTATRWRRTFELETAGRNRPRG